MSSEVKRVFIGALGYTNLRDLSVGLAILAELQRLEWPAGVAIDDLGPGGPIAAVHRFRDVPLFDRVILVGAVGRSRQPGQVYCYRWDGRLPEPDEIQMRVSEGVTGVISLDNLLIVGGYFAIWPHDVVVVEVEPRDEDWGADFSEPVQAAIGTVISAVQLAASAPLDGLSTNPLTAWEARFLSA
jgi:hydrogenase maturation protease